MNQSSTIPGVSGNTANAAIITPSDTGNTSSLNFITKEQLQEMFKHEAERVHRNVTATEFQPLYLALQSHIQRTMLALHSRNLMARMAMLENTLSASLMILGFMPLTMSSV